MKIKELKKYLGETIEYRTIWDTFGDGKLIKITGNAVEFEKNNDKSYIKAFNIVQVQLFNEENI